MPKKVARQAIEGLRAAVLRSVLPGTAIALLLLWLASAAFHRELAREFGYIVPMAFGLLLLNRVFRSRATLLSCTYIGCLLVLMTHGFWVQGWSPAVVALLMSSVIYSSLLLGHWFAFGLIAGQATLITVLSRTAEARFLGTPFPTGLEPTLLVNWIRIAIGQVALMTAAGFGLKRTLDFLRQTQLRSEQAGQHIRTKLESMRDLVGQRAQQVQDLQSLQRFQLIEKLGWNLQRDFSGALNVMRSAVQRLPLCDDADDRCALLDAIARKVHETGLRGHGLLRLVRTPGNASHFMLDRQLGPLVQRLQSHISSRLEYRSEDGLNGKLPLTEAWLEQVLITLALHVHDARGDSGKIFLDVNIAELPLPPQLVDGQRYVALRLAAGDRNSSLTFSSETNINEGVESLPIGMLTAMEMLRGAGGLLETLGTAQARIAVCYLPVLETGNPPPQAAANSLPAAQVDWGAPALRKVSALSAAVVALVGLTLAIHPSLNLVWHWLFVLPLCFVFTLTSASRWSYRARATLFLGSGVVAALLLTGLLGFMAPPATASVCLVLVLSAVFGSARLAALVAFACLAALIGSGYLHAYGYVTTSPEIFSPAVASNWLRVAVVVPSIASIGAVAVGLVIRAAELEVRRVTELEAQLNETSNAIYAEIKALAKLRSLTAKSTRFKALGQATAVVVHDLNNCLLLISAWSQSLAVAESKDLEMMQTELTAAFDHSEALIRKLSSKTQVPTTTSLDLAKTTRGMKRQLQALLGSSKRLVVDTCDGSLATIDANCFRGIMQNLVANARDAMPTGGECHIDVKRDGHTTVVAVSDNGSGMSEETRAQTIQPFFSTKGDRGTGLGLHSVRSTVEACGGKFTLQSEHGMGTRIELRFPHA